MKFNFNLLATNVIAALFVAGLSTAAMADNKAALKDSLSKDVKIAEAKLPVDADFKKLDVNGNTKISLKEAVKDKDLSLSFDLADTNKDGNISPDEYANYKASKSLSMAAPAGSPSAESASAPTAAQTN